MKRIRNAVLLAAVVAGGLTSSAWAPAWAQEGSSINRLPINDHIPYHYFYHPPSYYDPTARSETSRDQPVRTPVSKKYDAAFVQSKATTQPTVEPVAMVVAPMPATAEQKAAQMQQEFGIPQSDLQSLSLEKLTELDLKIRTIQRLQNRYRIAPETLVHQSLDALQKLEWKLQQGR